MITIYQEDGLLDSILYTDAREYALEEILRQKRKKDPNFTFRNFNVHAVNRELSLYQMHDQDKEVSEQWLPGVNYQPFCQEEIDYYLVRSLLLDRFRPTPYLKRPGQSDEEKGLYFYLYSSLITCRMDSCKSLLESSAAKNLLTSLYCARLNEEKGQDSANNFGLSEEKMLDQMVRVHEQQKQGNVKEHPTIVEDTVLALHVLQDYYISLSLAKEKQSVKVK